MYCRAVLHLARRAARSAGPAVVAAGTGGRGYASRAAASVCGLTLPHTAGALLAAGVIAGMSPAAFAASPPQERSFIMIKPDGVNRGLVMDILKRLEQKGYKLVGIKVLVPSRELASKHYAEHEGKPFFEKLVAFLSSGAVVATVWEGPEIVKTGRQMIGATNPLASAPGTIRGDYGISVGRNIIHGSDAVESAQKEIALWFKPEELAEYKQMTQAAILE